MFTFISKFRSLDFQVEGFPPMAFKDFQFSTDNEEIAKGLRGKRDISEVVRDADSGKLAAPPTATEEEKAKIEERVEVAAEKTTVVESGMRTSLTKEKKGRWKR